MALTLYTRTYTYTGKDNTNCSSSNPRCTVARSTFSVSGSTKKMGLITKIVFTHYHSAKGHINASLYGRITMWNGATYNSNTVTKEINQTVPSFTNTFTFNNLDVTGAAQGAEWSKIQVYGSGSGLYWRATSSQPMKVVFYFYAAEELFDGAEKPNILLGDNNNLLIEKDDEATTIPLGKYLNTYSIPNIKIKYQLDQTYKEGITDYQYAGIFADHNLQLSFTPDFQELIYDATIRDVDAANLYKKRPDEVEGKSTITFTPIFNFSNEVFGQNETEKNIYLKYTITDAADNKCVYRPPIEGETAGTDITNGQETTYIRDDASFAVLKYNPPIINSFNIKRYSINNLNESKIDINGNYLIVDYNFKIFNITYTEDNELKTNAAVLTIEEQAEQEPFEKTITFSDYDVSGEELTKYYSETVPAYDSEEGEFDYDGLIFTQELNSKIIPVSFSSSNEHQFTITLSDLFQSTSLEVIVPKGGAYFNVEANGVAVGMLSTGTTEVKKFEVAEDYTSSFYGGVAFGQSSSSSEDNPKFECEFPAYFNAGIATHEYHDGDVVTIRGGTFFGYVTSSSSSIRFVIPLRKSLERINSATLTQLKANIANNGGYAMTSSSVSGGSNYIASNVTRSVSVDKIRNVLEVYLNRSAAWDLTNNDNLSVRNEIISITLHE